MMIKVERLEMNDIINAPYIDRFVYILFSSWDIDYKFRGYLNINPLKWSIMTVVCSLWILIIWTVILPIVGIPCMLYDAHNLKSRDELEGWYQSDVWLLRPL